MVDILDFGRYGPPSLPHSYEFSSLFEGAITLEPSSNVQILFENDPLRVGSYGTIAKKIEYFRTQINKEGVIPGNLLFEFVREEIESSTKERVIEGTSNFQANVRSMPTMGNILKCIEFESKLILVFPMGKLFSFLKLLPLSGDTLPKQSLHPAEINTGSSVLQIETLPASHVRQWPLVAARCEYCVLFYQLVVTHKQEFDLAKISKVDFSYPFRPLHVSFNPFFHAEAVITTASGSIHQWSWANGSDQVTMIRDALQPVEWSSCCFGSQPRTVVWADRLQLQCIAISSKKTKVLFDVRLLGTQESITALAKHPSNPFYLFLASTNYLCMIDERLPEQTLLKWLHGRSYEPPRNIAIMELPGNKNVIITQSYTSGQQDYYQYYYDDPLKKEVSFPTYKQAFLDLSAAPVPISCAGSLPAIELIHSPLKPPIREPDDHGVAGVCYHLGSIERVEQEENKPSEVELSVFQLSSLGDVFFQQFDVTRTSKQRRTQLPIKVRLRNPDSSPLSVNLKWLTESQQEESEDIRELVDRKIWDICTFVREPKTLHQICTFVTRKSYEPMVVKDALAKYVDASQDGPALHLYFDPPRENTVLWASSVVYASVPLARTEVAAKLWENDLPDETSVAADLVSSWQQEEEAFLGQFGGLTLESTPSTPSTPFASMEPVESVEMEETPLQFRSLTESEAAQKSVYIPDVMMTPSVEVAPSPQLFSRKKKKIRAAGF